MSITLNMIVKNEEELLPLCLKSIREWVDEIVIVDTGSTDGTPDICKNFDVQLGYFDWVNDFSVARNYSLSLVKTPWTIWLDADDICLNPHILPTITEQARKHRVNGIWSTYIQDASCQQRRLQIFKTKDYKWMGSVHESPNPKNLNTSLHEMSDLQVFHRKPRERCQQAAIDYLNILLEKEPENWLGLAESYRFLAVNPDDPTKAPIYKTLAEDYYWKAATNPGVNTGTQYMALFNCAKLGMEMAAESKNVEWMKLAFKNAQTAYQLIPERAEALVLSGQIADALGFKEDAKEAYLEALKLEKPKNAIGVYYDAYYDQIPKTLLATL